MYNFSVLSFGCAIVRPFSMQHSMEHCCSQIWIVWIARLQFEFTISHAVLSAEYERLQSFMPSYVIIACSCECLRGDGKHKFCIEAPIKSSKILKNNKEIVYSFYALFSLSREKFWVEQTFTMYSRVPNQKYCAQQNERTNHQVLLSGTKNTYATQIWMQREWKKKERNTRRKKKRVMRWKRMITTFWLRSMFILQMWNVRASRFQHIKR